MVWMFKWMQKNSLSRLVYTRHVSTADFHQSIPDVLAYGRLMKNWPCKVSYIFQGHWHALLVLDIGRMLINTRLRWKVLDLTQRQHSKLTKAYRDFAPSMSTLKKCSAEFKRDRMPFEYCPHEGFSKTPTISETIKNDIIFCWTISE